MRAAVALALLLLVSSAGCGGQDEPERELVPGRVAIGVVLGEPVVRKGIRVAANRINNAGGIGGALTIDLVHGTAADLLGGDVDLVVLPCREGLHAAARAVEEAGALAVAPCNDGTLDPGLRRIVPTGLSPRAQADALADFLGGSAARVLPAETPRARRVRALLALEPAGTAVASPEALEGVLPPPGAPDGAVFATYGFPDPGNRVDEFAERYKAVFGQRPGSILAALGADALEVLAYAVELAQSTKPAHVLESFEEEFEVRGALGDLVFPGGTLEPEVEAAIVRLSDGRLRSAP